MRRPMAFLMGLWILQAVPARAQPADAAVAQEPVPAEPPGPSTPVSVPERAQPTNPPRDAADAKEPPPAPAASSSQGSKAAAEAVNAEAGFFPEEGFVIRTKDGNNKLHIGLQSLMHVQVAIDGKPQLTSPFVTLRPVLDGNIYREWIRFKTSLELAANPVYLLDSFVQIQPIEEFGIRIGQQPPPFSRHEYLYGPHQLLFPDWDLVSNYFWTGRDKGISAAGTFANQLLGYDFGAYVGAPLRQFETSRGNYLFVGRFDLNPRGLPWNTEFAYAQHDNDEPVPFKYAIGINGYMANNSVSVENFNPTTFMFETTETGESRVNHAGGVDLLIQSNRVMALFEWYVRRTDPHMGLAKYTSTGGFGQLGYLLYRRKLDIAVRISWADVNVDEPQDQFYRLAVNSTWYFHSPNIAFKLRYGYAHQQFPSDGATTSGGAGLIATDPATHVMTAQINTSF